MYKITVYANIHGEKSEQYVRTAKTEATAKQFARRFLNQSMYSVTIEKVEEVKK